MADVYRGLNGNAGTDPATDFLGTTDSQALNLRVNNARALRLEPASDGTGQSPNVIGGTADKRSYRRCSLGDDLRRRARATTMCRPTTPSTPPSSNTASGQAATAGGGNNNTASGSNATVAGGFGSIAAGDQSFVAGNQAQNTNAAHDGVFLFSDSSAAAFSSGVANEFVARASGGFRFVSGPTTSCTIPAGTAAITCTSDRHAKTGFDSVSPGDVLAQVSRLSVDSWVYKDDPDAVRHIGPTAQAFKLAFGIGEDPRAISALDADGVALAAIKGLNERVEALNGKAGSPAADAPASASSLPPTVIAGIAALGAMLAAALGAALTLRWSGRGGGEPATS